MNQQISEYLIPWNAEIASVVTDNHLITNAFPLSGLVEHLTDPPVKPKRTFSDGSLEGQVVVAIFERIQSPELVIRPDLRHHPAEARDLRHKSALR